MQHETEAKVVFECELASTDDEQPLKPLGRLRLGEPLIGFWGKPLVWWKAVALMLAMTLMFFGMTLFLTIARSSLKAGGVYIESGLEITRIIAIASFVSIAGVAGVVMYLIRVGVGVAEAANTLVAFAVSSSSAAGAYSLLKTWVDARNGRKLKIKVGDIEVEATQMQEKDVLRIFEMLEEKADRKKIRDALLEAGKASGRPDIP